MEVCVSPIPTCICNFCFTTRFELRRLTLGVTVTRSLLFETFSLCKYDWSTTQLHTQRQLRILRGVAIHSWEENIKRNCHASVRS